MTNIHMLNLYLDLLKFFLQFDVFHNHLLPFRHVSGVTGYGMRFLHIIWWNKIKHVINNSYGGGSSHFFYTLNS